MNAFLILFAGLLSFSISSARADWEADFSAVSSKKEFPRITGKFFSKVDQFRVDTSYPFDMSLYAKNGGNQIYAGVHSFKIRLSSKPDAFAGQVPPCVAQSFEKCVSDLKLKKIGKATCADKTCDVYEGAGLKGLKKIMLWHLQGEKEPIFAKSVLTKKNGAEITTHFSKISKKSHPDSFYSVPADYRDAGSLETFIGDFKGKSEE